MGLIANIEDLAKDLEKQELESTGAASANVYEQLLAIYLYQNDLCNAKYLWKRIPLSIKNATPELGHIWTVGQNMWTKDYPAIYKALNSVTWSETVSEIMAQVQEKVRCRAVELITQAYSIINIETVSDMTGLSNEVCITACQEKGWQYDPETKMIHPVKPTNETSGYTSSEDQLHKLTDFVSFLEN